MTHDRQLPENNSAMSAASKPSRTYSVIVADWLIVYGKAYREEISEELVLLYCETLKDLRPEVLHKAFLEAAKKSKFRPTPAEVREAAGVEIERQPKRKSEAREDCEQCRGTGWKMVEFEGRPGKYAAKCECRRALQLTAV